MIRLKSDRTGLFAFFAVLLSGLAYLLLLGLSTPKVFSGFVMQLIFLVEIHQNNPSQLSSVFLTPNFWANFLGGLLWLVLVVRLLHGLILSLFDYHHTRLYLKSLNLTGRLHGCYIFNSPDRLAFTSGFINPQVYISTSLTNLCSKREIKAILLHEQKHVLNHDPLKDFLVKIIHRLTPPFPLKSFLFNHYSAMVEVDCDHYACGRLASKRPIVSALYKILSSYQAPGFLVSPFAATSQRIHILIGRQKLASSRFFALNLSAVSFFVVATLAISHSDLFFECRHLLSCLNLLVTNSTHLQSSLTTDQDCTPVSSSMTLMTPQSMVDIQKTCHDHLTNLLH